MLIIMIIIRKYSNINQNKHILWVTTLPCHLRLMTVNMQSIMNNNRIEKRLPKEPSLSIAYVMLFRSVPAGWTLICIGHHISIPNFVTYKTRIDRS